MKKILPLVLLLTTALVSKAQDNSTPPKKDWEKIDLSNRANDHFMIQYGYDGWNGVNDTTQPSGFSRHFNFYAMFDKPFKSNPHYSLGIGAGISSSNIFFDNKYIDLKSTASTLPFKNVSSVDHFSKYKLTTIFLEIPIEFRFAGNPENPDKGIKLALGIKGGTILKSYTKGKNLVNSTGQTIYGNSFIAKESNKRFINSTRLAATGRIGFGNISLDGSYQITSFLKTGTGPTIHPYSIGITLSGL